MNLFVIVWSDTRGIGRKAMLTLGCERNGKYRPTGISKLNGEEKSLPDDMTKNVVKQRSILLTLKYPRDDNINTLKQIYNAYHTFRVFKECKDVQYSERYIVNIFRCYNTFNAFYIMLIVDITYKINKYWLPLLEMINVTLIKLKILSKLLIFVGIIKLREINLKDERTP
ncbi:hypothetical protein CR513_10565, partial [Mucuna pruriens]